MIRILFIEDDLRTQKVIKTILPADHVVTACTLGKQGLSHIRKDPPDLVLLDLGLPDIDGFTVLEKIFERPQPPPVIILTCSENIPHVVKAVKMGAADYLLKPFKRTELLQAIRKGIRNYHTEHGTGQVSRLTDLDRLIGASPVIHHIKSMIVQYNTRTAPVLITGESGTGKDLAARLIHETSSRKKNPFLALNCSALPPTLIETELFGSEAGAFTGAVSKPGFLERANGGTLFLDEIGDMELLAQSKLLRFLDDMVVTRIGGTTRIEVDVRIIAATNKPLKEMVREKFFREDLYYRLRVLPLGMPPLRDRREDIPLLISFFLKEFQNHRAGLNGDAMELLLDHPWPGNVRELKSVLERAAVLAENRTIGRKHILF